MKSQLIGLPLNKINLYTFSGLDKLKLQIEDYLSTKLNFDTALKIGTHQKSAETLINKYYDSETLKIFNELYKEDIELYETIKHKNI